MTRFITPRTAIIIAIIIGSFMPIAAFAQTWQGGCVVSGQQCHDISDFVCPVTDNQRAYSAVPDCPSGVQAGQSCAGYSGYCKVNTISGCNINTLLYECVNGSSSCTLTSPGSKQQTGTAWVDDANSSAGGTALAQWNNVSNDCTGTCESTSGAQYCFTQKKVTGLDTQSTNTTFTCAAFGSGASVSSGNFPPQTTYDSQGDPATKTTDTVAVLQPVYSYSNPTYTCGLPTASLSASNVSITSGQTTYLTSSCTNATSANLTNVGNVSTSQDTHPVSPTSNTTYTLTCSNANGNANASVTISVTSQLPDIVGAGITPTTATAGTPVTFVSQLANSGSAAAQNFYTLFQKATDSNGSNATDLGTFYESDSVPGGGNHYNATYSYTFPSGGTYYIRACGDKSSAGDGGVIAESNESNNCGPWTTVAVAYPGVSGSCSVSPSSISTGGSATWSASGSGGNGSYSYSWTDSNGQSFGTGPSAGHSYPNAGIYGASVTITSGGSSKTVSCSNSVTVSAGALPDIVGAGITPTTATAGTPVQFVSQLANNGNAAAQNFYTLFQKATDSNGSNATDLGTFYESDSVPGGGNHYNATYSYTFPSGGTYYIRACGDKSSAGDGGVITESDESNNCGPWTAVAVGSTPANSVSCTVNDTTVTPPATVTYTASGGQTPYTWNDALGGSYGTGSTASRSFPAGSSSGNYGMDVTDPTGGHASCPTVVVGNSCTNLTGTISANPTRVPSGGSSTITWSASGVNTSCKVSGPGVSKTDAGNACTVNQDSAVASNITTQSVYTLTCDGTQVDQVIVNVIPAFQEF